MNRAEAEFILGPIILGFEVAKGRARELLEKSQEQGLSRDRLHELFRHEADLEQAISYIQAREKAWAADGLMQAVDTGRTVATWPTVLPGSDFKERTITAWKESRHPNPANIQTLQRPA